MATSDALILGEDFISEHYFTTDSKSQSFQAKVIERRKQWDAARDNGQPSTRSRYGTVKLIGGLGDSGLSFVCFAYVLAERAVPGHVQAAAVVVAPVISFQTAKRPAMTCR